MTPLTVFLASEANPNTHDIYSVGGGRFARIFIGACQGWMADQGAGTVVSAEDVQSNLDQIRSEEGYIVPTSIAEEMGLIASSFKGA